MTDSGAESAGRHAWDRLDAAIATLQGCTSLESLVERACELALACCAAQAAAFGWVAEDGTWIASHRGGDTTLLEYGPAPVDTTVRCHERAVGVLRLVAGDTDPLIVDCYADGLSAMIELLALRQRADVQRHLLGRLRGTLGEPPDNPVTLITELAWTDGSTVRTGLRSQTNATRERLTDRQREVLDLMSAGLTNVEIGERLVIAMPTVKSHVRAVLRAIGAVNRADAIVRYAVTERDRHRPRSST